jgi:hypothetical protein
MNADSDLIPTPDAFSYTIDLQCHPDDFCAHPRPQRLARGCWSTSTDRILTPAAGRQVEPEELDMCDMNVDTGLLR